LYSCAIEYCQKNAVLSSPLCKSARVTITCALLLLLLLLLILLSLLLLLLLSLLLRLLYLAAAENK
jgi:hypothetical protein